MIMETMADGCYGEKSRDRGNVSQMGDLEVFFVEYGGPPL
jgi:hypothetical protein